MALVMTQYANNGVQPQSQGSLHFTGTSGKETWERGWEWRHDEFVHMKGISVS